MGRQHMQIGEVANRTGLSLRTIRYYEEMGLIVPSARSAGGFRLYTEEDVARLMLVKRMKPLDFPLEEMRDLLTIIDAFDEADAPLREELVARLEGYHAAACGRVEAIRAQLDTAQGFADDLADQIAQRRAPLP